MRLNLQSPLSFVLAGALALGACALFLASPRPLRADAKGPTTPLSDPNADQPAELEPVGKKGKREKKKEKKKEEEAKQAIDLGARTAPEWYAEAVRRVDAGKYQDARAILLPLEDSPRALDIQESVKLLLADSYFYNGGDLNYAEALARYRSFLTFFPNSARAAYAQFQVGECYFRQLGRPDRDQSYTANAIREYQRVQDAYPESEYAKQAEDRQLEARARAARHEFEVVRFYHEWENYAAALKRVSEMLVERPESPDREQALYIAADSCYRLGRASEGDAYAARLRQDYPGTKWDAKLTGANTAGAQARVEKMDRKRQAELRRTYAGQRRREDRRTRQIRKDSGFEARMPEQPVRHSLEREEVAATGDRPVGVPAAAPVEPTPENEKDRAKREKQEARQTAEIQKKEKLAKQSEAERKRQEKLEAEEQEQASKEAEREKKEAEKKAAEDAKKAGDEKAVRKEAEKQASEEAKAAKDAEKEKARQDKAEAEEQAAAKAAAERAEKDRAKAEAKKAKQAEKDAEKARREAEKARREAEEARKNAAGAP